jgi:PKD repeat protein
MQTVVSRRTGKESIARRRDVALAGLVMLALAAGPTVIAQDAPAALDAPRPGGRVIVKLRPALAERVETVLPLDALHLAGATAEPDVESFLVRHGIRSLSLVHPGRLHAKKQGRPSEPDLSTTYVVETSARTTAALEQTLERLRQDPEVEVAEPDQVARISEMPSDPSVAAGAMVAVVDTGVDLADPDIAGRAWSNLSEVAGNGLDDDENGYVDDVQGWDFVGGYYGTPTPDADPADVHGHGTRVARTVAAGAQVMAVKGLDDHGSGFDSSLAAAIVYAADNGAEVIHNRWRGRGRSQAVAEAIQYAASLGVVVIAADDANDDARTLDPTSDPDAVTVGASSEEIAPLPAVPASAAAVTAVFDAERRAPRCLEIGHTCDSGTLLDGRAELGPEPNQPNTIGGSCADGTAGIYHSDESNDRIRVSTLDGTPMAPGKTVRIQATVWAYQAHTFDRLDLYYAANGSAPQWTFITTLAPTNPGFGVLSATYTLPEGAVQAVRARLRYADSAAPCRPGSFVDHDDLIFQVIPANQPPVAHPGGPYGGAVGAPIQFSGLGSSDPDGDSLTYTWHFGDGVTGSGPTPTHAYGAAATYTASLTVSDGATSSAPAQVSVNVIVSGDVVPPTVSLSDPAPGARLRGLVVASAEAADNVAVTRVEFYVDGVLISTDTAAPYRALWDTRLAADGPHTIWARGYDAAPNSVESVRIPVVVANGKAVYDASRRAPRCTEPGPVCDSGSLLNGRGPLGPEPNHPNTMDTACVDGTSGSYHVDESNDRIRVFTLDGTQMAPGKVVRVEATVWAHAAFGSDRLELYHTAAAGAPAWTHLATLTPASAGSRVLSTTFTLPAGPLQAVRARFGFSGSGAACSTSSFEFYTDRDDLIFPVPANGRPVANPGGPYSGKAREAITLSGAGSSDPEGAPLTYAWDFGDGATGTGPAPTHTYLTPGTYAVTLTVNDGLADSLPATTTLTVINQSPVANPAGPYAARRGALITFNGSGTDADGDALSYRWDFGDGHTGSGAVPTHAYASRGTFPVVLTVNDGFVDSAPATTTATITNNPPVANPGGPYAGARGTPISFAASGTDADGDDLTYRWTFGDGTTTTGANVTHVYLSLGTFTVTLVASDGQDDSAPATTTVTIANRVPVANPGVGYQGVRGAPIKFNGSGTDADGDPLTYRWSFGDGSTGVGNPIPHAYASLGIFTVTLVVNDGLVDSAPATTTADIFNRPPDANPGGPYTGVKGVPITFNGSGSDADGDALTYRWEFGDGTTGTGPTATHAYAVVTTFTARLIVNDGRADSGGGTTTVTIVNRPPIANPGGPYVGARGEATIFNGSGTDADGDVLTYNWNFGDGTTGPGGSASHVYASAGTFTATLTVNDGRTDSAPATTTVAVTNRPVAIPGGPYTGAQGVPIAFNGSGTDLDGDPLTYRWTFGDGGTGTGRNPTHAYASRGTFNVSLTVNDGRIDSLPVATTVAVLNRPPVPNPGGPYTGVRGVPIAFSGSGTDPDGDVLNYWWMFGDGTSAPGPGPTAAHAYAGVGTLTATLVVTDGQGATASATTTVTIANRVPVANPGGPYTAVRGVPITLSGSGADADGDSLTYSWNFGDGSTGPGASASHAYANLGTFVVTLTVSDGFGGSASATTMVTIVNLPPVANAGSDGRAGRNSLVILSGSGSDPDGSIVAYRWRQVSGPGVVLSGANTWQARFMAPSVFATTPLAFELTVTDNDGATAWDEVVVTVCGNPKACFDE